MTLSGALMVCGTASSAGKSRVVAGLCRTLARRGVNVAPFKGLNMSLNSTVTRSGHEIARSQAHQAVAARIEAAVQMGPVLVKPSGPGVSQLVVMGRPAGEVRPGSGWVAHELLETVVLPALGELRERHDVVVLEGAGGAAEINLLQNDIANLPLAAAASVPAFLVADIERGGAFASIYGSVMLLPDELRARLRGFVINKFRGDGTLLQPGIAEMESRLALPCLGVLPHLGPLGIDEEDSLALPRAGTGAAGVGTGAGFGSGSGQLDVAVVALPHISNFTDFDPFSLEGGVNARYVSHPASLGNPDLVVLPGSKATVDDLAWLRASGFEEAISAARRRRASVLGICAGYQMLGREILDEVESGAGRAEGLGLLPVTTKFLTEKTTLWSEGVTAADVLGGAGLPVRGFQIRHGQPTPAGGLRPWFVLGSEASDEGVADDGDSGGVWGTSLHGLFENDALRASFLAQVAKRRGKSFEPSGLSFSAAREQVIDRVADAVEACLDVEAVCSLIAQGAPPGPKLSPGARK
jgi:adenosylcobyric acid synthase